jgi:uncharacterized protein YndB with AHSA1/START domain
MEGSKEKSVINIHEIYIKAPAAAIWEAITSPEWSLRYGYRGIYEYDLRPGGQFRVKANEGMRRYGLPETIIDGAVIECSPPTKLVQTYRFLFDDQQRSEGFSRITFEIEDTGQGFCRLTVTHDVTGQPTMGAATTGKFDVRGGGGGWNWILSDLKSLLETGTTMA